MAKLSSGAELIDGRLADLQHLRDLLDRQQLVEVLDDGC
jgi:hypothetical protein